MLKLYWIYISERCTAFVFGLGHYVLLDSRFGSESSQTLFMSPMGSVCQTQRLQFYYHMDISPEETDARIQVSTQVIII